tara:strand:+ start:209 stop:388 length:180 start_codon:yes stop_codon:yes gene_type:complete
MYHATTTMTGSAAIRALSIEKKKVMKCQSVNKCYNLQKDFVDWCEIQNEELLRNTGSIA